MTATRAFLKDWILPPKVLALVYRVAGRLLRKHTTIGQHKPASKRLFILGNGPSLKKDLEKHGAEIMSADRLAVNFTANNDLFEQLKPTLYLVADPQFFAGPEQTHGVLNERMAQFRDAITKKTSWAMTLVVPAFGLHSELVASVAQNPNITVLYYDTRIEMPFEIMDFPGMVANAYKPPSENVLNTAVYLGIFWRYPETIILGADTSFHATLNVEQDTNRIFRMEEHYYGNEKRYMYRPTGADNALKPSTLSAELREAQQVFASYEKLRAFADYMGVKVVNASSFSWIDAFERPPLK